MNNTVCIPYRADTPERAANFARTFPQWAGWNASIADSDGETFGRSQAVNRAVAEVDDDWDVVVIADSDLLLESTSQAAKAIVVARELKGYIACYDDYYYLDEDISILVREGMIPTPSHAYYHLTGVWIGMFAIHREPWDAVARVQGTPGAFDDAIKSWGGEDGRLLRRLEDEGTPKDRVAGRCYHLKHPLAPGAR